MAKSDATYKASVLLFPHLRVVMVFALDAFWIGLVVQDVSAVLVYFYLLLHFRASKRLLL